MCLDGDCDGASLDRRTFLYGGAAAFAGLGGFGAEVPRGDQTQWPTRVLDHPGIQHGPVTFTHGGKETIGGFLARPRSDGVYPAVLVIAGNRITEEYIPNTCAALAVAGFVGLAPDIFHLLPDGARTREEMNAALRDHTDSDVLQDVQAGADYLEKQPFVRRAGMGVLGFCFGGRMAMLFGARSRNIDAVVPFHPGPVTPAEIARLRVPVQVHSGRADRQVSVESIAAVERMLRAQSTPVEVFLYDGADHGFLAYTRPTYKPDAAQLAWKRTAEFLGGKLA